MLVIEPRSRCEAANPFDLGNEAGYRRWRHWKLALQPRQPQDLFVDVRDPRDLSDDERIALQACIARAGFAIYRSRVLDDDPDLPRPRANVQTKTRRMPYFIATPARLAWTSLKKEA